MDAELIEIFVHAGGRSHVVQASPSETVREVFVRLEVIGAGKPERLTFIGECEEALVELEDVENGADDHPPIDIDLTLEFLNIRHHRHVHHHPCRHIAIDVNFGGATKRRRFSPAATVETVARWARRKFHVDTATAAEYVLQVCGGIAQPRSDQHLSQLAEVSNCALCFDLVPEVTPQG